MIPPVTFGRGSGKFILMKARIYLLVVVLAVSASLISAWAQEAKTNGAPVAGESAASPPSSVPATSAPAAPKPAAGGIPVAANPAPVQPKVNSSPRMSSETAGPSHKETATNPPPPVVPAPEAPKPPEEASSNAASSETENTSAATPSASVPAPEGSGLDRKTTLIIGAAILVIAGGLAFFMWRRASLSSHGSLISSALSLTKFDEKADDKADDKNEDKAGEKGETGTEMTSKAEVEPKKEEKIFPPPMN